MEKEHRTCSQLAAPVEVHMLEKACKGRTRSVNLKQKQFGKARKGHKQLAPDSVLEASKSTRRHSKSIVMHYNH